LTEAQVRSWLTFSAGNSKSEHCFWFWRDLFNQHWLLAWLQLADSLNSEMKHQQQQLGGSIKYSDWRPAN